MTMPMKAADRAYLIRQVTPPPPVDTSTALKRNLAAAEADELRTEGHEPVDKPRVNPHDDSP